MNQDVKNEIFDIVDRDGKVIGQAKRSEAHGNPSLLHRVVHCLVFNSRGELYLQKRSETKDIQPGKWDTSVGGHMIPGETPLAAIRRETEEELHIKKDDFIFLYRYILSNEIESEMVDTFKLVHDGRVDPDPSEISEGRFWKESEIEAALKSGVFTPNFEDEWNHYCQTEGKRS